MHINVKNKKSHDFRPLKYKAQQRQHIFNFRNYTRMERREGEGEGKGERGDRLRVFLCLLSSVFYVEPW